MRHHLKRWWVEQIANYLVGFWDQFSVKPYVYTNYITNGIFVPYIILLPTPRGKKVNRIPVPGTSKKLPWPIENIFELPWPIERRIIAVKT